MMPILAVSATSSVRLLTPRLLTTWIMWVSLWGWLPDPEGIAWVLPRLCPQSVASFGQSVRLSRPEAEKIPRGFILCGESGFDSVGEQARQSSWGLYQLDTGHDPKTTKPREVAEILLNIAGGN